jgi:mono/diheme cytochrome c family protein
MKSIVFKTLLGLGAALLLAQIIPYGRDHSNPPVRQEPTWDRPETRQLARRACLDCHSNETVWPWYSAIAPVSWLVQRDVIEGRGELNFSEWDRPQKEAKKAPEETREGEMPPRTYLLAHPEARLDPMERAALAAGLQATLGRPETTASEKIPVESER